MLSDIDITCQMLSALTVEQPTTIAVKISVDEQKKYLKKYIDAVNIPDKKAIGNLLIMNNMRSSLHECNEGIVINLDKLPDKIITQMYELLEYKISKRGIMK